MWNDDKFVIDAFENVVGAVWDEIWSHVVTVPKRTDVIYVALAVTARFADEHGLKAPNEILQAFINSGRLHPAWVAHLENVIKDPSLKIEFPDAPSECGVCAKDAYTCRC